MTPQLADIVERAIQMGALRRSALPVATPAGPPARPWPVILLTAFGVWLVALPLFGALVMFAYPLLSNGVALYVFGLSILGAAVWALRREGLTFFAEQLAVALLALACLLLSIGIELDLDGRGDAALRFGLALMAAMSLVLAALLPQVWLRILLGAEAAQMSVFAFDALALHNLGRIATDVWVIHGLLAVGVSAFFAQRACERQPDGRWPAVAAWLEAVGGGWMLMVLAHLAWWSGQTFTIGGTIVTADVPDWLWQNVFQGGLEGLGTGCSMLLSGLLTVAAAAWAAHAWPTLRRPLLLAAVALLVVLALLQATLGACLLVMALMGTTGRRFRAGAAACAAAWIGSSFYYLLDWSLATKGLLLACTGAVFAALAWRLRRETPPPDRARPAAAPWQWPGRGPVLAGIGMALLATLAVVNFGIARSERLIATGRPIYLALRPVDPRSLMQGDYMRLAFSTNGISLPEDDGGLRLGHPCVVLAVDGRGVASLRRNASADAALAPDELIVQLTSKGGRWVIVTDGWFFKEGEAERFAGARFGEFRVDGEGKALLVGLADEALKPLR